MPLRYWLMKSEAECFSFKDLMNAQNQTTFWDGVRNYEARNMMRDLMKIGDKVLYYHSNAEPPGVAGIAIVTREGYPDDTAFDPTHEHFHPKSDPDNPMWFMVDITAHEEFPHYVTLPELRSVPELAEMKIFTRNRLSVSEVTSDEFRRVCAMGRKKK